jgi:hypothetical protein
MKKILFGLIATVILGFVGNAQNQTFLDLHNKYINSISYNNFNDEFQSFYDKINLENKIIRVVFKLDEIVNHIS